jgi:hypothetical protein
MTTPAIFPIWRDCWEKAGAAAREQSKTVNAALLTFIGINLVFIFIAPDAHQRVDPWVGRVTIREPD